MRQPLPWPLFADMLLLAAPLGLSPMTATEREDLDSAGYVVLTNFLDQHTLEKVRDQVEKLYELEGEKALATRR